MRYVLSIDIEDTAEMKAFFQWLEFHSKRLKCLEKDVLIKLAQEYQNQMKLGLQSSTVVEAKPNVVKRNARKTAI